LLGKQHFTDSGVKYYYQVLFLIKGGKTEVAKNLILSEAEFDKFKQYCYEKGFDLAYFGPEIQGSKEEIEHYQFSRPKVIKLRKRRFSFQGIPYDVAVWQEERWGNSLAQMQDVFFKKGDTKDEDR
jgi:hypothetical protein